MSAFRTRRLHIDALAEADVAAIVAALAHPEVSDTYFLGGVLGHEVEELAVAVERLRHDPERFCGVARDGSGQLMGLVQLCAERLSYFVVYAEWGRGYATELVTFARETLAPARGLASLSAQVERENVRSRRVLESNAFRFVGLHDRVLIDGRGRTRTIVTLRYVHDLTR